jgi:Family of unknown function (DUF6282)
LPRTQPGRSEHPQPSNRARELVRGAFDLHVHIEPDLIGRRTTDLELARRFGELGLAGFVLKSHYVPTAERAAVVTAAVPGAQVIGAITLNAGVGGLNPLAVEIAARQGARIVWLPTVDAANEAHESDALPAAKQPLWRQLQNEFAELGVAQESVPVVTNGNVVPALEDVLGAIARHDLVLATGHLGADEIEVVVDAAIGARVSTIVVTHPDYPTQGVSHDAQRSLAERGALLERCFAPIYSGKVSWEQTFDAIRATGVEHNVLSTDLGQPRNPPVEDGLALMADRLLAAGFADDDVRTMAVTNTQRLAQGFARV